MMYLDNLRMLYGDSVELHKAHTYDYKCNTDTQKLGVVELLDKYEVACGDEIGWHAWMRACLVKYARNRNP